jgi:hypothetical protein
MVRFGCAVSGMVWHGKVSPLEIAALIMVRRGVIWWARAGRDETRSGLVGSGNGFLPFPFFWR